MDQLRKVYANGMSIEFFASEAARTPKEPGGIAHLALSHARELNHEAGTSLYRFFYKDLSVVCLNDAARECKGLCEKSKDEFI